MKLILILTTFLLGVALAFNEPTQVPKLLNEADPALTSFFLELLGDLETSEQALFDAQEHIDFLGEALTLANTRVYGLSDENWALAGALDESEATLMSTGFQLDELTSQVLFRNGRVAELIVQVANLDTQLSSALIRADEAEDKALALGVYEVQVTHLNAQLLKRQRYSAELSTKVNDLEVEISLLENNRMVSDETIRNLQSNLKGQTQARLTVEDQVVTLEKEWGELSSEVANQLAELALEKAYSEDLEGQLQNYQMRTAELAVTVTNLEGALGTNETELESLNLQLENEKTLRLAELALEKTHSDDLEGQVNVYEKQTAELAIMVTDLEGTLSRNETEIESLNLQLENEKALQLDATALSREAVNELRILQVYTASLRSQLEPPAPSLESLQAEARTLVLDFQAALSLVNRPDSPENSNVIFGELVEAQQAIAEQLGYEDVYVVQEDDTLSTIASAFYDNPERWIEVFEANTYLISDQDRIFPGLVLVMPR